MNEIIDSTNRGSKIYICGNGGSSATTPRFCCDFNKGVTGYWPKKMRILSV